jgi:hypothetical protein
MFGTWIVVGLKNGSQRQQPNDHRRFNLKPKMARCGRFVSIHVKGLRKSVGAMREAKSGTINPSSTRNKGSGIDS